jgi:ABC-type transport system involved in multi-copper enzyme maturation permease subunit
MMLLRIASFELHKRLRMLSTYVYFAVFFGIGFLWMSVAGGAFPSATADFGAGGKIVVNAPFAVLLLTMLGGYFGTIITAAIAGRATFQDVEHDTTAFFYCAPISKLDYLGGRFLGAMGSVLLLYPGLGLGAWLATLMPFIDGTRVGPQLALAYLSPYFTILLPNLVFTTALFFALATLLRRMLPVYVGAVVLVLGYLIAGSLTSNIDNRSLAAMLDPFGGGAADRLTEYWTIAEKNSRLVPLAGVFLWNRVLWTGLGLILLVLTYVRFSFSAPATGKGKRPPDGLVEIAPAVLPRAPTLDYSRRASFAAFLELTRLQLKETVKNVFFLVIVLAGVLFVIVAGMNADQLYGTKTWPVTYEVLEVVGGTFSLFILIIITFYSGELVWRERDARLAPIFDTLPIPRWVIFASKLAALMLVQVILVAVLMVAGIALQAAKGYFHFELGVYVKTLFGIRLVTFWILCATAMLVHVVVNNKYVGHFVMVLYFMVGALLPLLGLEHPLYRFSRLPPWSYSAMNGFGHYVLPIAVFQLYWGALAVAFAIVANALWVRGLDTGLKQRAALAWSARSFGSVVALAACLVVSAGTGSFIFWNTNVLNEFHSSHDSEARQAFVERTYRKWRGIPQPVIESVKVACDIFPEERRVAFRGTYGLENESSQPIAQVLVRIPRVAKIAKLSFGRGETRSLVDASHGFYVYDLPAPLAPHEKATLEFDVAYDNPGFPASGGDTRVVYNGTFFNDELAPHIGYASSLELEDDTVRHKQGLEPRVMPPAGDPIGSMHNYAFPDANWMGFDATVSTSADQLAIAPGYLDREWTEGGRRYFHYAMDSKILGFYSFLSARYTVLRDHWSPPPDAMPGSQEVAIEIDYQQGHEYDIGRMVAGIKKSLDYYTVKLGPYQHHQVRIVEFPRYEQFAQSFPNTIPYSESIGFLARVDDAKPDDIDYPFYVTAHEVAHQWWAHQVISGDVQGATMLSESMAQYSALMVMKREFGADKMKRFLRYELDRYLRGRGASRRAEMPLVRVEDQLYVHYSKGSLAMYALQDYIGEDAVDAALAKLIAKYRFQPPPYPDATDLVAALRAATPPEYPHLIEDLFETITLFENRAMRATYSKRADGKYDVVVDVRAKKLRATELGGETEVPLDDFIDVGVVDKDGKVLALERKRLDAPESRFTLTVDAEPAKAGIDPLNKLIDRMPDDNLIRVEKD